MTDTLSVVANPYAHVDENGRLAGACPKEAPSNGQPLKAFVGAEIDSAKTQVLEKIAKGDIRELFGAPQDTVWKFDPEPQKVPNTAYYRERLRYGEILAADAETAAKAGVPFVSCEKALASAKAQAIALLKAAHPDHTLPQWAASFTPSPAHDADEHEVAQ